uniref:Uncharacterized protein n=1 Tax=Arundo donax TaxID=35708 RepID=A0A0A9GKH5_ARUDO
MQNRKIKTILCVRGLSQQTASITCK